MAAPQLSPRRPRRVPDLPAGDFKADQVRARLAGGVHTVTGPKSGAAKPRHIEVKAAGSKS